MGMHVPTPQVFWRRSASRTSCSSKPCCQRSLLLSLCFRSWPLRRNEVLGHWGPACLFMPLWVRNSGGATGFSAAEGGASGVWGSGVNFSAVVDALTTNHKRLLKCLAEKQLSQVKRCACLFLLCLTDPEERQQRPQERLWAAPRARRGFSEYPDLLIGK